MRPTRRTMLAGAATLILPASAFAQAAGDKRLVLVILRGGMDGLAAAPPIGDPAYARARGSLAQTGALRLDATFALHPRLPKLHALYQARELLPVHACATAYRERSHFDGQNVLETGATRPFGRDEGWLNKALGALPPARSRARRELGVALAAQAPLVLRGGSAYATWSPSALPQPNSDVIARLMDLYERSDPQLAAALQGAVAANAIAGDPPGAGRGRNNVAALARVAANFLQRPDGPVAAVIEFGGWDTHANQGLEQGPLARNLTALDDGMEALKVALGPAWRETVVIAITEFGRTVAPNGGGGTDHGTASAAFLAGGAVAGGRVLADWPGLAPNALHEGRDLRPTIDLRGVLKGALSDHLAIAESALGAAVFPGSQSVRKIQGLIRS